jgi:hypothetical protein
VFHSRSAQGTLSLALTDIRKCLTDTRASKKGAVGEWGWGRSRALVPPAYGAGSTD